MVHRAAQRESPGPYSACALHRLSIILARLQTCILVLLPKFTGPSVSWHIAQHTGGPPKCLWILFMLTRAKSDLPPLDQAMAQLLFTNKDTCNKKPQVMGPTSHQQCTNVTIVSAHSNTRPRRRLCCQAEPLCHLQALGQLKPICHTSVS